MNRLRFIKVRDVQSLKRSNQGDAGLDFYIPRDLTVNELMDIPQNYDQDIAYLTEYTPYGHITEIILPAHSRILIPSGIKLLIEPRESMLMAANKSGVSTKSGLIFTAEIVDSPYVGEVHIGVVNTSNNSVSIKANQKLVQFIHVPIYLTEPEEIQNEEFYSESQMWGSRGTNGFGSTDNQ